jgi:hypothetical protein
MFYVIQEIRAVEATIAIDKEKQTRLITIRD